MQNKNAYDEKSCGTILFCGRGEGLQFLLIRNPADNRCGFPKGHVEDGESETETALRETWEETSIKPKLIEGFRRTTLYPLKSGRKKLVVYFLGCFENQTPKVNPSFEKHSFVLLPYEEARRALAFQNARELLDAAYSQLKLLGYTEDV